MRHGAQAALVDLADRRVLFQHLRAEGDDVVEVGSSAPPAPRARNSHSAVSSVCSGPSGTSRTVRT